jgi:hypothetical protein
MNRCIARRRLSARITFAALLLAGAGVAAGCSSPLDQIMDNQVARIVEEQNQKLPVNLENGIELTRINYDADSNLLTLRYTVEDRQTVRSHIGKIRREAQQRVRADAGLQRALQNGIRVFHEFRSRGEDQVLESFETKG